MVKVHDGLVLATDSAITFGNNQVYNNADKIFNLHRDLPIAAMTWGLGSVGSASNSTLAKDLRRRLMGLDDDQGWKLDVTAYTIKQVAERMAEMFHDRLKDVNQQLQQLNPPQSLPPQSLGLFIGGYSAGERQSEAWVLFLDGIADDPPDPVQFAKQDVAGWNAFAVPQPADRLFNGYDTDLLDGLLTELPAQHHQTVRDVLAKQGWNPVYAAMPFPDAIALAKFLVEVTAGCSHFLTGPDTVGGPIEVAGVNRHEGFKWISRKHYYSPKLNKGTIR
jgi:hypothetical protein